MTLRLLVADDHRLFLEGIRTLLAEDAEFEIVAEAQDGAEAIRLAREHAPDVVVMDISMGEVDGIEATREVRSAADPPAVLCLSMHREREFVRAALEAGAAGYVPKDCALEELRWAIRLVAQGRTYLSPEIADVVVADLRGDEMEATTPSPLSSREREVLTLIASGLSTKEAAAKLDVSTKTVSTHRENLMGKLEIRTIAGLTKYAIQNGFTSLDEY